MLLTQMLDAGHVNFKERCADWRSAIRAGCEPLVASGAVDAAYADEIIASIEQYGPYRHRPRYCHAARAGEYCQRSSDSGVLHESA